MTDLEKALAILSGALLLGAVLVGEQKAWRDRGRHQPPPQHQNQRQKDLEEMWWWLLKQSPCGPEPKTTLVFKDGETSPKHSKKPSATGGNTHGR